MNFTPSKHIATRRAAGAVIVLTATAAGLVIAPPAHASDISRNCTGGFSSISRDAHGTSYSVEVGTSCAFATWTIASGSGVTATLNSSSFTRDTRISVSPTNLITFTSTTGVAALVNVVLEDINHDNGKLINLFTDSSGESGTESGDGDHGWDRIESYERSSRFETCARWADEKRRSTDGGPDTSFVPSWEQWAHGGKGWWTCTRKVHGPKDGLSKDHHPVGGVGPGGGQVFLVADGVHYEMAPNTWAGTVDPIAKYCNGMQLVAGAAGSAVGTGAANTAAMAASTACNSQAATLVTAYSGNGFTDWYLPSEDELNAMCNYSRDPESPLPPTTSCYGTAGTDQATEFSTSEYAWAPGVYWSSTQTASTFSWRQYMQLTGYQFMGTPGNTLHIRPIRSF